MLGIIGIFLGFAVLLVGVWRKYHLILAALAASAVIGPTNGFTLAEPWTTYLVQGTTSFSPLFLDAGHRWPVRHAHGRQPRRQESGP